MRRGCVGQHARYSIAASIRGHPPRLSGSVPKARLLDGGRTTPCVAGCRRSSVRAPVTAIDPTAVTTDGFGPVPGFDDGNPATVEQPGWRPLVTTPNHPEYPAAHGSLSSATAEVYSTFLGTNRINIDVNGFDPAGPPGNLDALRHFARVNDLTQEVIDARLWAGLHYHFSGVAGVVLGRKVAQYDLRHAFQPTG